MKSLSARPNIAETQPYLPRAAQDCPSQFVCTTLSFVSFWQQQLTTDNMNNHMKGREIL